jgi:hypothetical protein
VFRIARTFGTCHRNANPIMPLISFRALLVFKRATTVTVPGYDKNEEGIERSKWKILCIKRFPSVELRARKSGLPSIPSSDLELAREYVEQVELAPKTERIISLYGIVYEGEQEPTKEVLAQLEISLETVAQDSRSKQEKDDLLMNRVLCFLNGTIPFGSPVHTESNLVEFHYPSTQDKKVALPQFSRAYPIWFPGQVKLATDTPTKLKRFASSIIGGNSGSISIWIEETIHATLYRHDDEFKNELEQASFWSSWSTLKCLAKYRSANELTVSLNSKLSDHLFGLHECVQRIEREGNGARLSFIPPYNEREGEADKVGLELCRWRVESYSPSLPSPFANVESTFSVKPLSTPSESRVKHPIRATYRLRQMGPPGTSVLDEKIVVSYQIIVRLSCSLDGLDRPLFHMPKLKVLLFMPCAFLVVGTKLQSSSGNVSYEDCFVNWDVGDSIFTTSGTALLSGIIVCTPETYAKCNLNFHGETSCAIIDFHLKGSYAAVTDVSIAQLLSGDGSSISDPIPVDKELRDVKSGNFIVWNPFGEYPRGVPVHELKAQIGLV